ncbi:hypothetical protein Gpo141_00013601 [Globisporangium polare]
MPAGGGGLKRWSAPEDAALLRAWAEVATDNGAKSLQKAFEAQCAAASLAQERSANSLQLRRGLFMRMYEIVCAFHKSRHQTTPGSGDDGGDTLSPPASGAEYSSDSWFELPVEEQKRWFASLNTRAYAFSELAREEFELIDAIFEQKYKDVERRPAPYTLPRKEKGRRSKDKALSTTDLRTSIARLKGTNTPTPSPQPRHHQRRSSGGAITPHKDFKGSHADGRGQQLKKIVSRGGGNGDGNGENGSSDGSSTESDDEIPTWDDDDENEEAAPQGPVKYQMFKRAELEPNISKTAEYGDGQVSEQSHQVDRVDLDFLELASILETQARHIGEVFLQMKRVRREESRERRYVLQRIEQDQSERNRVLEDITQREQELQREREEWEEERRALTRELAQLRKEKRSEVDVATSSPSCTSVE